MELECPYFRVRLKKLDIDLGEEPFSDIYLTNFQQLFSLKILHITLNKRMLSQLDSKLQLLSVIPSIEEIYLVYERAGINLISEVDVTKYLNALLKIFATITQNAQSVNV